MNQTKFKVGDRVSVIDLRDDTVVVKETKITKLEPWSEGVDLAEMEGQCSSISTRCLRHVDKEVAP